MARAGGQLAIPKLAQLAAQRLLGHADLELVVQPLAQIDHPPAHHAVHGRDRPALDRRRQGGAMRIVEPSLLAGRLAVDQTRGPVRVELDHPVPHDLQRHAADPGRLGARGALADRGQRQQPARLAGILALARRRTKTGRVEILSKRDRHDEAPRFAVLESKPHRVAQAPRVTLSGDRYKETNRDTSRNPRQRKVSSPWDDGQGDIVESPEPKVVRQIGTPCSSEPIMRRPMRRPRREASSPRNRDKIPTRTAWNEEKQEQLDFKGPNQRSL